MILPKRLDLYIHARGQIEFHQGVHRLLRRLENIQQSLVYGSQTARATSYPRAAIATL